jgi:hypothetical protein
MGTAATEEEEEIEMGKSSVEGAGNASTKAAEAASACHSFGEVGGEVAGQSGARLSVGCVQQADAPQSACLEPQHLHMTGTVAVLAPPGEAKTPCQDVTMPIRMARSKVTTLESRVDIAFILSARGDWPFRHWADPGRWRVNFQFFNLTHVAVSSVT